MREREGKKKKREEEGGEKKKEAFFVRQCLMLDKSRARGGVKMSKVEVATQKRQVRTRLD